MRTCCSAIEAVKKGASQGCAGDLGCGLKGGATTMLILLVPAPDSGMICSLRCLPAKHAVVRGRNSAGWLHT